MFQSARSFRRIPYGMPTDQLYPVDTAAARETMGIRPDEFVIAFGAMDVRNRRKGSKELVDALESISCKQNLRCLVFGSGKFDEVSDNLPSITTIGTVDDEQRLREIYSVADAFVLPSLEDNLPLTGLEAMACGTPVIAFDAGGIPDYVIPGITGMVVPTGDSRELSRAIAWASSHRSRMRAMGGRARSWVCDRFEAALEARRYRELYQEILAELPAESSVPRHGKAA